MSWKFTLYKLAPFARIRETEGILNVIHSLLNKGVDMFNSRLFQRLILIHVGITQDFQTLVHQSGSGGVCSICRILSEKLHLAQSATRILRKVSGISFTVSFCYRVLLKDIQCLQPPYKSSYFIHNTCP